MEGGAEAPFKAYKGELRRLFATPGARRRAAGSRHDKDLGGSHEHYRARNYRFLVPLIAQLTGDAYLDQRIPEVLAAIDRIYRARTQAAEAIFARSFPAKSM